jgi:hypothetical protein
MDSSLSPAVRPRGGGAELRDWARWVRRTEYPTLKWRVRVAGERLLRPASALDEARRGVRAYGDGVADGHGVSHRRQLRELYLMRLRYELGADSYYRFQLFRPERRRALADYVDAVHYESVLRRYLRDLPSGDRYMFKDKRDFARWAGELGLPAVGSLLTVDPAHPPDPAAAGAALPDVDLFTKPADLASGKGTARWVRVGERRWRGGDGVKRSGAELIGAVAAAAAAIRHPMLVQESLRNHAELRPFTAGGLCTTRMVTARPFGGGAPRLLFAILRMPVGDAAADNFDGGGVAAAIDPATGRLGIGMRKDARLLAAPVEHHPTTGARIPGCPVPDWAAGVDIVCRGHAAAPPSIPIVGWDLAFTDRGPVLVEANNVPGINLIQMPIDTPLGATPLVATLLPYLRARYMPR